MGLGLWSLVLPSSQSGRNPFGTRDVDVTVQMEVTSEQMEVTSDQMDGSQHMELDCDPFDHNPQALGQVNCKLIPNLFTTTLLQLQLLTLIISIPG